MIPAEILNQIGAPITALTQFTFQCQRCGDCCRNRFEAPIILTGYDMYRLAGAISMRSTLDLIEAHIVSVHPNSYGLPVCVLAVTPEGTCCLLEENQCLVHEVKPVVCAMYPLGRIYDAEDSSYTYIHPYDNICAGTRKGSTTSAAQWLKDLQKHDPFHAACEQAYADVLTTSLKVTNMHYMDRIYARTIWALFGGFNPRKEFLPQLEENLCGLRPLLKKAIKKSH